MYSTPYDVEFRQVTINPRAMCRLEMFRSAQRKASGVASPRDT